MAIIHLARQIDTEPQTNRMIYCQIQKCTKKMIISKQGSNITLAFYDLGALFNIVEIFIEFYYGMFYLQQEY